MAWATCTPSWELCLAVPTDHAQNSNCIKQCTHIGWQSNESIVACSVNRIYVKPEYSYVLNNILIGKWSNRVSLQISSIKTHLIQNYNLILARLQKFISLTHISHWIIHNCSDEIILIAETQTFVRSLTIWLHTLNRGSKAFSICNVKYSWPPSKWNLLYMRHLRVKT